MNKQPEVTEATREAFVNAFFQLAQIKSIHKITIREITNLAGYNRTTFYRYFEDIFALIEYAEDELLKSTWKALDAQNTEISIGEKRFFEIIIRCFHESADRVSVLLSEENRSHFLRKIRNDMTNDFQRNDSPKRSVVRNMYFSGIFYAISVNLQNRDALSDEDLLDIIQKLFDNWFRLEMADENGS